MGNKKLGRKELVEGKEYILDIGEYVPAYYVGFENGKLRFRHETPNGRAAFINFREGDLNVFGK